jgi:phosphoribosyl 1,2-cyclic phosphodiesterase
MPVSGEEYLRYGGDTTCLEIRTKNDEIIIIDAGSGIRRLGNNLLREKRHEFTMLFTHSHWDHIVGFPSFRPIYYDKTKIALIGCPAAQGNIKFLLSRAMSPPLFPVSFEKIRAKIDYHGDCPLSFRVDSVEVFSINLSHPNMGTGYKFVEDGKTFVFLTDNELRYKHRGGRSFEEYADFTKGADLLIHDAEYTPEEYKTIRSWGHSTYVDAIDLAFSAQVQRLGLFHHNQERDDAAQDTIVRKSQELIKSKKMSVECFALTQSTELVL